MVVILRLYVRGAVAEFLWCVTDLTKDGSPRTGYTFTPWVVSFTPPSIEHQAGGTSILRLFRRTVRAMRQILGIQTGQPGRCSDSEPGTQLRPPIQVLALPDDRLTSCKRRAPNHHTTRRWFAYAAPSLWNPLPTSVKHSFSIGAFESSLKTYVFNMAYPSIHWLSFCTSILFETL